MLSTLFYFHGFSPSRWTPYSLGSKRTRGFADATLFQIQIQSYIDLGDSEMILRIPRKNHRRNRKKPYLMHARNLLWPTRRLTSYHGMFWYINIAVIIIKRLHFRSRFTGWLTDAGLSSGWLLPRALYNVPSKLVKIDTYLHKAYSGGPTPEEIFHWGTKKRTSNI